MGQPVWTKDLVELKLALEAHGYNWRPNRDGNVDHLFLAARREVREVTISRKDEAVDLLTILPFQVAPSALPAFDLALAEVNARLAFPGLRRSPERYVAYVIRHWLNDDGTIDARIVMDALATIRQMIDDYEPLLAAASKAPETEVSRG